MRPDLAWIALLAATSPVAAEIRFERVNPEIQHSYTGGWEHFVGGGVAAFDCNGDGLSEVFAAGGDSPAVLLRNASRGGAAVSMVVDTPAVLALTGVTGAYPINLDGDAQTDLVVLRVGENVLLRGLGQCQFEQLARLGGDRWTTAFSATWEQGQDRPTLVFGNYVDRSDSDGPFEACDSNQLLRPVEGGWAETLLEPGYCALSVLFSDWGLRGRADLRVSNDRHYYVRGGAEQMWAMQVTPRLYGPEDGWQTHQLWGMGIASRDISGDGLPEVYLTSMGDQHLHELVAGAGPTYQNAPFARGHSAHRPHTGADGRPSTGWHAEFGDVDADGRDDLFVAKGNVDQMPDMAMEDPNSLLHQQPDGSFQDLSAAAGVASMARSRGAVLVDLDADGRLDLVVNNRRAPIEIYRNISDSGRWIALQLHQDGGNADAIGARIELRSATGLQTREVTIGGGHVGGQLGPAHFGLGQAEQAEIRVTWPGSDGGGVASDWVGISAGRVYDVRAAGQGLRITPR